MADFENIMLKKAKLADLAKAGKAKLEGNPTVLKQLAGACELFDPMFEIMPGTKTAPKAVKSKDEPFAHDAPVVQDP